MQQVDWGKKEKEGMWLFSGMWDEREKTGGGFAETSHSLRRGKTSCAKNGNLLIRNKNLNICKA